LYQAQGIFSEFKKIVYKRDVESRLGI